MDLSWNRYPNKGKLSSGRQKYHFQMDYQTFWSRILQQDLTAQGKPLNNCGKTVVY